MELYIWVKFQKGEGVVDEGLAKRFGSLKGFILLNSCENVFLVGGGKMFKGGGWGCAENIGAIFSDF